MSLCAKSDELAYECLPENCDDERDSVRIGLDLIAQTFYIPAS